MMQRRGTDDPSGLGVYPNWAWSWPANRRVLYNRASCDPDGKPWDPDRKQIWWNEAQQRWAGVDVPDFKVDSPPKDHMGPFIMNAEGVGRLFAPLAAFADGPFPEHYEPAESPVANPLHPNQSANPVAKRFTSALDKLGTPGRGLQHRLHHLPAHRALPLLDQEQPDERAARAGAVRRDPGRAGRRPGTARRREGQGHQRARPLHRQGDGDAPHQADDDRWQENLPDRNSDSLGLSRHRRGRGQDAR